MFLQFTFLQRKCTGESVLCFADGGHFQTYSRNTFDKPKIHIILRKNLQKTGVQSEKKTDTIREVSGLKYAFSSYKKSKKIKIQVAVYR